MKLVATLILIFCCGTTLAQFPKEIHAFYAKTRFDHRRMTKYEDSVLTLEEAFFRKQYADKSSTLYGKDYAKTFKEYYYGLKGMEKYDVGKRNHTVIRDFDFDGDLDVLFTGRTTPGVENTNIILFFNNGKSYVPQEMGIYLDSLYSDSTHYYFRTSINLSADYHSYCMEFQTNKMNPEKLELVSNEVFSYYAPADSLIKPINCTMQFPAKKEIYFDPDLSSVFAYNLHNEHLLGMLPENTPVHVYDYAILNGKMWFYLVISPDDGAEIVEYYKENSYSKVQFFRGWVCAE